MRTYKADKRMEQGVLVRVQGKGRLVYPVWPDSFLMFKIDWAVG